MGFSLWMKKYGVVKKNRTNLAVALAGLKKTL